MSTHFGCEKRPAKSISNLYAATGSSPRRMRSRSRETDGCFQPRATTTFAPSRIEFGLPNIGARVDGCRPRRKLDSYRQERPLSRAIFEGTASFLISLAAPAREYHAGMHRRLFALAKPASADNSQAWRGWLGSAGLVAIALAGAFALERFLHVGNLPLVFLPAVLASAIVWGLVPSLFACLLSVLSFNFFFLPPLYTFTIADPENILALAIFAVVSAITSELAVRTRRQVLIARRQERQTADLYEFSRSLADIGDHDELLLATARRLSAMVAVDAALLLPRVDALAVVEAHPSGADLDRDDVARAERLWRGEPAAEGAWLFVPLQTESAVIGIAGVRRRGSVPLTDDERRLVTALADQAAVAIERVRLARDVAKARIEIERERLRAALLTSISHDLRTPLASIVGAASSLRSYGDSYSPETRSELAATIYDEAERLDRFVRNLLDMTRLEAGSLRAERSSVDLAEIVGTAVRRAARILEDHRVETDLPSDLPMLDADFLLADQVLFNLLDNAAALAPPGSLIRIAAWCDDSHVAIEVSDEGPGIPSNHLERVFEKFVRVEARDRKRAGTGLGLTICRGFVAAMGGTISAQNRQDRSGAVFTVTLPVALDGERKAILDA
jgi:two-component system, OmpR family, sensor histidine kinase KdpD